jgi:GTPase SAR1 family protein
MATIGASFASKNVVVEGDIVEGKSMCLQIWDTAGEEKYRAMTRFYYRDCAIGTYF